MPTRTPLALFLEQIRSILQTLAHHAQEIERIIRLKFNSCPGAMPRETHYLTMLYHQVCPYESNTLRWPILISSEVRHRCNASPTSFSFERKIRVLGKPRRRELGQLFGSNRHSHLCWHQIRSEDSSNIVSGVQHVRCVLSTSMRADID